MGQSKKNRWISLILCLCFITLILSAEGYIAAHVDHECNGTGCPVCLQIQWARDFARHAGDAPPRAFPGFRTELSRFCRPPSMVLSAPCLTAVRLKVKMNA